MFFLLFDPGWLFSGMSPIFPARRKARTETVRASLRMTWTVSASLLTGPGTDCQAPGPLTPTMAPHTATTPGSLRAASPRPGSEKSMRRGRGNPGGLRAAFPVSTVW